MYAARRAHAHGHVGIPRRQLGLDLPPGLQKKTQNQNRPSNPGKSDKSSTPPPEPDPAPPASQKSTPAANYEGGGYYDSTISTSSTTQTRTTSTSSLISSPSRNPNQGPTGYAADSNAGVANAGSRSSGSDHE